MKRGIVLIILGILITSFLIINLNANNESPLDKNKISSEVLEKVEQEDNVRVFVNLKSEIKKGREIASKDVKKEVSELLKGKIKHEFDEKFSAFVSSEDLKELKNNSNIESIEIVGKRYINLQDSVPLVNSSTELWNLQFNSSNITGKGETVCILDTGTDFTHPDLQGKNLTCIIDCITNTTCVENCSITDGNGHGTHVAGIIGADGTIKGVAPEVNLIAVQVCNAGGSCNIDDTELGIQWCVDNADTYNISVISMSLGANCNTNPNDCHNTYCNSAPEADEINSAVGNNISVLIATGNQGNTTHIAEPSCIQNATPIGGTNKTDGMYSSSNRNNLTLLLAPGLLINSTVPTGGCSFCDASGYKAISGTSMSTPHVSAAFAIINQYRKLEGNAQMTPAEIEDALNDSGKVIYDSGSGINYSRIQIYQTILAIDSVGPVVTLETPTNEALSSNENQTFTCSAEDVQLSNLTFYLWNCSGSELNNTFFNSTGNDTLQIEVNQTLQNGTYFWNCLGYDDKGYSAWANSNYTLYIGNMLVTLNSPSHNTYASSSNVDFNCTIQDTVANITNVTFYLWNSSSGSLIHNVTENMSGTVNTTTFNYTFSSEESYKWNCRGNDEDSNSVFSNSNYTITYDNTDPIVNLESPDDAGSETAGTITFEYNVSDTNTISNCSIIIDGDVEDTDTSINKEQTQDFDVSLTADTYEWRIRCYDIAGNSDNSELRDLTITSSTTSDDGDDGDSTSSGESTSSSSSNTTSASITTFTITGAQFDEGYTNNLEKGDKILFSKGNESHTLELETVSASSILVKISSNPISLYVSMNETRKADLDSDNTYDLSIKYNSYADSKANITIKAINESIGTRTIAGDGNQTSIGDAVEYFKELSLTTQIIIGVGVLVLILGVAGFFIYRKHKKKLGPVFKKKYEKLVKK